ncbi:hypothetical protein CPC08DRAFT_795010 [Agrocybe pediades]|nr:hypothetical protein CPC08DRAFT_795010 [Agrocybe pediades]
MQGVAAPQAYGDPRLLVPFFRLWNPALKDDFYTVSVDEKNNAIAKLGYNDEGVAGYLWPNTVAQQKKTIPLYRVYNGQAGVHNHFYTTSPVERDADINNLGYANEGTAGYVYNDTLCGGLPLYRLWSARAQNEFYTMDANEVNNVVTNDPDRYVLEKVAAWIIRF